MAVIQIQIGEKKPNFLTLQFFKKSRFVVSNRVLQTYMSVGITGCVVEGYVFKMLHKLFEINTSS